MPNPYDKYGPPSNLEELFPSQPRQGRARYAPPMRRRQPEPEELPVEAEPATPAEEELGWFRTYGPHVVRGIGGLLGVTPATGAIGGGGAEIVAQAIEQGDLTPEINPRRVAAETALGAAGGGFAKLLGAGVTSVARALGAGAALGGAAPVIRHGVEEGEWDPREYAGEVGTGAAIGGAVGGGLAKLLQKLTPSRPAGPASRYEIETTAVPGGQVLGPGKQKTHFVETLRPIHGTQTEPINVAPAPTTGPGVPEDLHRIPYMGAPVAETTQQAAARLRAEAAQTKADLEKTKLAELKNLFAGRGDTETRLNESVSAVDPETGHRLGATFREIAEEGGEGGGGVLTRQGDTPTGPAGGDLQAEIERVKAELAQATAEAPQVGPMARLNELRDKAQAGTLTAEELVEARALDADLRGRGFPPDEPPLAGSPVAAGPKPSPTPSSGGLEAPIPVQPEAPAPSPLEEILTPKQAGKTRVSRPRKSKSERFSERAAKIAAEAEGGVPLPATEQPQSLAELIAQVDPNRPPTRMYVPGEGMVEAPVGADPAEAIAALRGAGPEAPALPGMSQQDVQELVAGQGATQPGLTRLLSQVGREMQSVSPSLDPQHQAAILKQQLGYRRAQAVPEVPVTPVQSAPEAPQDLIQILRTRVGASGKNYRLARDAAKSGEIPSANFAREAHLREQAALRAPKPAETTAAPLDWQAQQAAEIARLNALPKEQRLAAFLGENAAPPPPAAVTPEVPLATSEAEPAWVAEAMKEVEGLAAQQKAQPSAPAPKAPVSTVAELLGAEQPLVPPTAAQIAELQALRQQSGAVENPADVPSWLRGQIEAAPESPVAPKTSTVLTKPGQEGAPRLNKNAKYGGHEGPPNPQDYRPAPPRNPERGAYPAALATRLGLGLAGAAVGGATDPLDDPLLSAMAGGAVGLSIPTMAQGLMKLGAAPEVVQNAIQDLNLPDGVKRATAKIGRVLPQMQRAFYLADAVGLPANAWFGPYGSGVFGALERGLAGDPRGWAVLNELKNPWNFFREYPSAFAEARSLVGRAEGFSEAQAVGEFEKRLTWPGTALTAGDVSIRRILERHGFSEDEARIITMTGEPFTRSGEWLAHGRGFIPDITFPFKRTPVNIFEQGMLRTPGVGFLMQKRGAVRGTRDMDPLNVQLWQQGLGAGIGLGSEQLSENLDPEQARLLRRFVTNTAGPYSLLAGAGFAAGQAVRRGQPIASTTVRRTAEQLPLPTVEPIQDALGFGAKLLDQGPSAIREQDIPRGAMPTALAPSNLKRQYDALASFFTEEPLPPRRRRRSQ